MEKLHISLLAKLNPTTPRIPKFVNDNTRVEVERPKTRCFPDNQVDDGGPIIVSDD